MQNYSPEATAQRLSAMTAAIFIEDAIFAQNMTLNV